MLNKQEQDERARYISGLYGKPLKRADKASEHTIKHRWSTTLLVATTFSAPFSISSVLFSFYNNSPYVSLGDVQGWSMLFIMYFIGLIIIYSIFLKFSRDELYKQYASNGFIFNIALLFMIPLCYWLHELVAGQRPQESIEVFVRAIIYAMAAYLVAAGLIAATTLFVQKRRH